jgi:hypothetical protein
MLLKQWSLLLDWLDVNPATNNTIPTVHCNWAKQMFDACEYVGTGMGS